MAKLFEKIDDNPGSYFGMLVESLNESDDYDSEAKDYNIYAIKKDGSSSLVKTVHGTKRDVEGEINGKYSYLPNLSFIKKIEVRDANTDEKVFDESFKDKKDTKKKKMNESTKYEYLEQELAEVSNDKDIERAYDENELTIVKDGNVWYFEHCPYGLDKKVKKLMKKYYPELNYLYDESLKEDYYDKRLVQKLYSMWFSKEQAEWLAKNAKDYAESLAYGYTTTDDLIEAEEYVNSKMKKQEAIKEDKFVSRDKVSKKDKRELDEELNSNELKQLANKLYRIVSKYFSVQYEPYKRVEPVILSDKGAHQYLFKVVGAKLNEIAGDVNIKEFKNAIKNAFSEYGDFNVYFDKDSFYYFHSTEEIYGVDRKVKYIGFRWFWFSEKGYENESLLKEDKFVPKDKMSKKDKRELNDKKRGTWGNTNPVTRVQPNKKAYDRKRDKRELDEAKHFLYKENADKFREAYEYVQKIADEMLWDSKKKEIDYEDALYYYNKLKEATKMVYNSFIGDDNYDPYEDGNVVLRG